ncbi:hypothetical protein [Limnobacter parvus]|uniref:MBL fold metallo-hydrolase n=1 Tax=Limnobacter parvus TaxID=2939690 RepID=A0ABT1XJ77_9BURK|nr:hypothetical protein [Limnobacter parvus]MCR2747336.1 hypothetical protein [Limnobacter parvus]
MRYFLSALFAVLLLAIGGLVYLLKSHPVIQPIDGADGNPQSSIRLLFLGTSSMAWTDDTSTWLIDGFFSRPAIEKVIFTRLNVDKPRVDEVITEVFRRLNMPEVLSGIVVAHSHYDHSMDAPYLAMQYGGRLVGSESTWQIAKGQDLPALQMDLQAEQGQVSFGNFDIRLQESAHAPTGFTGGFNNKPVFLPAHALQFKEGVSYSFLVSHPSMGSAPFALIQPSAGFIPGQNKDVRVNTVLLGMGGLGKLSDEYIAEYWQEMVLNTQAKTVYLIHWDDFTLPLIQEGKIKPLKSMPTALDDFPRSLELLKMFSKRDEVTLHILNAWEMVYF